MNRFLLRRSRPRLLRSTWIALLAACASAALVASESAMAMDPLDPADECSGLWTRCVDKCPSMLEVYAECRAHAGPNCQYDDGPIPCHNARWWACGWNLPFRGNNEIRCGYETILRQS